MRASVLSLAAVSGLGSALSLSHSSLVLNDEFPIPDATPLVIADLEDDGSFLEVSDTPAEALQWTVTHNKFRCMHDAPLLAWDDCVAQSAQQHANAGSFSHSQSYQLSPCAGPAGENLAMGHGSLEVATTAWYNEYDQWKTTSGTTGTSGTGHFTAMVWKGVKRLGCGTFKSKRLYVCRYKADDTLNRNTPNMSGGYAEMVGRRNSKSEAQCKAEAEAFGLGNGGGGSAPVTTTRAPVTIATTTRSPVTSTTTRAAATTQGGGSSTSCTRSGRYVSGITRTMSGFSQADFCAMLCSSTSNCSHWSASSSSCTLHSLSGNPAPTQSTGWVSGQKTCSASGGGGGSIATTTTTTRPTSNTLTACSNPGVNLTGSVISSLNGVSTPSTCQLWCRLSNGCVAWTQKGTNCSLRSSQGSVVSDASATSGLRNCISSFIQLHEQGPTVAMLQELESEVPPIEETIFENSEASLLETEQEGILDSLRSYLPGFASTAPSSTNSPTQLSDEQKERLRLSIRATLADALHGNIGSGAPATDLVDSVTDRVLDRMHTF